MWARSVEVMLGLWFMMSPFVFRLDATDTTLWIAYFAAGLFICAISLTALWPRVEKLHFLHFATVVGLSLFAFLTAPDPPTGPYQNIVVVALLLLILAMIPKRAAEPPAEWDRFATERGETSQGHRTHLQK